MRAPFGSPLLDAASRLLVPFIALFSIYVLVHGHDSPGGGFQAGTMFAAAVILIRMVRGEASPWGIDQLRALKLACYGVTLYAGIGLLTLLCGGNYLDYGVLPLPLQSANVRAMGTLGIEIGVTMGVTGVLLLIFDALTTGEITENENVD